MFISKKIINVRLETEIKTIQQKKNKMELLIKFLISKVLILFKILKMTVKPLVTLITFM